MPFVRRAAALRRLRRGFESIADPEGSGRAVLIGDVQPEVKALLAEEFAKGIAPDGTDWQRTVRGRPALISRRLESAFVSRVDRGVLRFAARSTRNLLTAHQEGHEFPERHIAANKEFLSFNSKGKLVAARRIFRKDGSLRRGAYQRFAAAHTVKARTLPARPIYPEGALPLRWEEAIRRGLTGGLQKWAATLEK
jgi:archaeosine-15-forming tRNA-guanine transglycosylase